MRRSLPQQSRRRSFADGLSFHRYGMTRTRSQEIEPDKPHARFRPRLVLAVGIEMKISTDTEPLVALNDFPIQNEDVLTAIAMMVDVRPLAAGRHFDNPCADAGTRGQIATSAPRADNDRFATVE
jgi:hypothetical protein